MSDLALIHTDNHRKRIHPQVFALWVSFASIIMLFAAFTSAFIVKRAAGNWLEYVMPNAFYISTGIIVLSSICLHISYNSFKQGKEGLYKSLLVMTLLLGFLFIIFQYRGWHILFESGVDLKGSVSGSFFYIITGVHAAHILGGIAALIVALIHALTLPFKPTEKRRIRYLLVLQYWHFVDILWIYLFVFLLVS